MSFWVLILWKFVIWTSFATLFMKLFFLSCSLLFSLLAYAQDPYTTTNDLASERSPYLQQHANNPVAWKIWGADAFKKAEAMDRLVVVSVGYASCHWCHVMEEESFEDAAVAGIMNESYINIKVDREERPDVDQSYMTALRLMGADGGWPLNVIALPNGSPVYAGTYHSKAQWISVLNKMQQLYETQPESLRAFAKDLQNGILEENKLLDFPDMNALDTALLEVGLDLWKNNWDLKNGGNLGVQKFVRPNGLMFLMDYAFLSGDQQALTHVWNSLDKIGESGLIDQLSGGFFRYSIDAQWQVPHFEKMLYDNAQMVQLYAKAYKYTKNKDYKDIVIKTIDFLLRDFKGDKGGFVAAMDADLDGEEGAYYRWTAEELKSLITEDWPLFSAFYKLDHQDLWEGSYYVLQREGNLEQLSKKYGVSQSDILNKEKAWQTILRKARSTRGNPAIDNKIISSWNALLVTALVTAYEATAISSYLDHAIDLQALLVPSGSLAISHTLGSKGPVFSEDYAFLAKAALSLYFSTADETYLTQANALMEVLDRRFLSSELGLYFFSQADEILSPVTKMTDGVLPSDNGVAAEVNFLLGHINYDLNRTKLAKNALVASAPYIQQDLNNYTQWGSLWLAHAYPFYELAIIGSQAKEKSQEFLSVGLPNVLVTSSVGPSELPLFEYRYKDKETLLYVCENYSCKAPVKSVSEALAQIRSKSVIKPF